MKKFLLLIVMAIVLVAGVARADLVARYEFEGNFNDSSSNGHTGTPSGDATIVNWAPMPQTGMLSLDGDVDYVNLGTDSAFDLSEAFTITAWVNMNTLTPPDGAGSMFNFPIVNKYGTFDGVENRGYYFNVYPDGRLKARVVGPGTTGTSVFTDAPVVEIGEWLHAAVTYEYVTAGTSKVRLYANGELAGSSDIATGPINIIPNEPVKIGHYLFGTSGDYSFNGSMDDVRIYNNAMSAADIREMVVPEPMTMMLLSLGGLVLYRRRRA